MSVFCLFVWFHNHSDGICRVFVFLLVTNKSLQHIGYVELIASGEHTVHELQAILLAMVPVQFIFMANKNELASRGVWQ